MGDLRAFLPGPGQGTPDGRVLELGCGNGKLLRPLLSAGFDAVGLDVSWNALHRLGSGVLADASALPFGDASFATVLDIHCTGHLPAAGRARALQQSARVVVPGGHVVIERLGIGDLRHGQGVPVEDDPDARRLEDGRTTHFSDEAGLRAAVQAAGLEVVAAQVFERTPRLRTERVLRRSVRVAARRPDRVD